MRKNFGEWLRQQIKDAGYTQKEFAELIGIEQPHLSRIINGSRGTTEDVLKRIAHILNLSESYVIDKALNITRPENSKREKLDEALAILSMLDDYEIDEIIQIAKIKSNRRKTKSSEIIQPPSRAEKPARTVLNDK